MLLYALRYERDGQAQISDLLSRLQDYGLPRQQLGLVRTMLAHAGADKRVGDLFSNRSFSSRFATMAKQSLRVCVESPSSLALVACQSDADICLEAHEEPYGLQWPEPCSWAEEQAAEVKQPALRVLQ